MEGAWETPVFGGRFTGSPHAGVGFAGDSRDIGLGWRLMPEVPDVPDLSFSIGATRRESDTHAPEHALEIVWGITGKRALDWRVKASRTERDGAAPEIAIGIEFALRW